MSDFDYRTDSVVGLLDIDNRGNGHIRAYGYFHADNYVSLRSHEAEVTFKPKKEVFAYNAAAHNYELKGRCVKVRVKPNQGGDESKRDAFIWDFSSPMEPCGKEVRKIDKTLGEDGRENHCNLKESGLLDNKAPRWVLSNGLVYCLEDRNGSKVIPYCNMDDINLIYSPDDSRWFSVEDSLPNVEGYIDIMSDQGLVDWFVNKVLKTDMWKTFKEGEKMEVLSATKEAMGRLGLPGNVMQSRLARIDKLVGTFSLALTTVKSLTDKPWFGPTIEETLNRHKEELREELIESEQEVLQARKVARLEGIAEQRVEAEKELEAVRQALASDKEEQIRLAQEIEENRRVADEVQQRLVKIEGLNRDALLGLQEVGEVLQPSGKAGRGNYHLEHLDHAIANHDVAGFFTASNLLLLANLKQCLAKWSLSEGEAKEIIVLLAAYKVLLLPDLPTLMAVLHAMGRCSYLTTYVSVAWKSFADLWDGGLGYIVGKCEEVPDRMHFLVMRNINLSCIPNYLQPVFDLQAGLVSTFPGTDLAFPSNLRLLATASADPLIPMTADALRQIGCAPKGEAHVAMPAGSLGDVQLIGYITPETFSEVSIPDDFHNHFEDYVNE